MARQREPRSTQRPSMTLPPSSTSSSGSDSNDEIKFDLTNFELAASKVLCCLEPTREDITFRERLIDQFKSSIKRHDKLRGCVFEPYGSYATGLYTRFGDVDLSVTHQDSDILLKLYDFILRNGEYHLTRYAKGRVPVLTFKHIDSGIMFDITVHTASRDSGKMPASLLSHIKDIDPRFRQLVLLVKGWAMCHGINDASNGGFKSYALYVMVIVHLQSLESPILPPLSQLCTSEVIRKLNDNDVCWKREFDQNFARYKKWKGWKENGLDIYKIFYLFIRKFMHIKRKAGENFLSPMEGKWVLKKFAMMKLADQPLWIHDPFGNSENLGRTITDVTPIRTMFRDTYKAIKTGNVDVILANLVHEDLLKQIERNEIEIPSSMEVGIKSVTSSDMISVSSSAALTNEIAIPSSMEVGIKSVTSSDMISVSSSAAITNEIAIPSSMEVGIKSVASRDMISVSSSAAITKGTDLVDVLNLRCYLSDGDEDTEPEMSRPTNRRTASRSPYSVLDERIQDKELANSQKEVSPDNAEVKQSSSTSCLSLGTQEYCQNTRFSVEKVDNGEDKRPPRSRNDHNSDRHKESDEGFHRRNRRDSKGAWRVEERMARHTQFREYDRRDRDGHYSEKARRDVSDRHKEWDLNSAHHQKSEGFHRGNRRESEGACRVEERMARHTKVREYDRRDKDRHYSKKARHNVSGCHEKKEGVEEQRDGNEWKERVRSKTWIGHSRLMEDYRGEKDIESGGKQGRRDGKENEIFSWHRDTDSHDNRVRRRSRYERQNDRNRQPCRKNNEDVSSEDEDFKRKRSRLTDKRSC